MLRHYSLLERWRWIRHLPFWFGGKSQCLIRYILIDLTKQAALHNRIIGLAYPLYNGFLPLYLEDRLNSGSNSLNETYRDYTIVSVLGIPGSIIACVFVDWTRQTSKFSIGGRKLALAVSTALTGVFLFLFTTSKTNAAYLGYSCASSLTQNAVSLFERSTEGQGGLI